MSLSIRRALFSVSDKEGVVELAMALQNRGVQLIATGKTAGVLGQAGLTVTPIEEISGNPEAFQGRMKTLSFPVCSGILYRRGNRQDEEDLKKLKVLPIDCVVVNFYPFQKTLSQSGISREDLIEQVDIGGPTLVRAAAKNSPDVLVLTSPSQYSQVIEELQTQGQIADDTVKSCAQFAWEQVLNYDSAIARELGRRVKKLLRYGENPHQQGFLEFDLDSPIRWDNPLTSAELSYNNILDVSSAYSLASDLVKLNPDSTGVVIVKHNNPCGVCLVPRSVPGAQKLALTRAWEGDPVSAFGGVLVATDPIEDDVAEWLAHHFIELVAAPGLKKDGRALKTLVAQRKNLKALEISRFHEIPTESMTVVPGGRLFQTADIEFNEELASVTEVKWPSAKTDLARFGILVCRALKSNAIALVREIHSVAGAFQLVGAGQGQPNRIDALRSLAVPRAQNVLRASEGSLSECVMISDAFFPFRDTVDFAYGVGIRWIVQPGGSQRDPESIAACNEHGIGMVFTRTRHFRH